MKLIHDSAKLSKKMWDWVSHGTLEAYNFILYNNKMTLQINFYKSISQYLNSDHKKFVLVRFLLLLR